MEIILLLVLFQLKHYYADFVIQTYAQTVRKGIYRDLCGISHSLDHVWCTMLVLMIFSLFVIPLSAVIIIASAVIEGIIHYHIDWAKVHFGTKDMHSSLFWNQFGLDQLAHQLTYLAILYFLLF